MLQQRIQPRETHMATKVLGKNIAQILFSMASESDLFITTLKKML